MPWAPSFRASFGGSLGASDGGETHVVIFVDVDGVLNLGTRDDTGGAPLLFSDANLEYAMQLTKSGGPTANHTCVQKLVAISEREPGHGEGGTLASLVSTSPANVSGVLAGRLAQLIRAAGPRRTIVLSSSWRRPQHKIRAERLEQEISRHLGESFHFDDRTPLRSDDCAQERLQCIGEYVAGLKVPSKDTVRILVLEDFFITPMRGWFCGGVAMHSTEAVEQYLMGRCPASVNPTVRVVHTYDEWMASKGLRVEVGVGLTLKHFCNAMCFLDESAQCGFCVNVDAGLVGTPMSIDSVKKSSDGFGNCECSNVDIELARDVNADLVVTDLSKKDIVLPEPGPVVAGLECLSGLCIDSM